MTGRVQDGRVHHPQQIHGSARGSREAYKVCPQIYLASLMRVSGREAVLGI